MAGMKQKSLQMKQLKNGNWLKEKYLESMTI